MVFSDFKGSPLREEHEVGLSALTTELYLPVKLICWLMSERYSIYTGQSSAGVDNQPGQLNFTNVRYRSAPNHILRCSLGTIPYCHQPAQARFYVSNLSSCFVS